MRGVLHEFGWHLRDREDMVYQARGDGAAQDAVILSGVCGLGHGHPAVFLDRLEAEGAVGAGAGEDDADRVPVLVGGQRAEEMVDGRAVAAGLNGWGLHVQDAALDGQSGIGRDHVDVVGLDRRLRRDLLHGHAGVLRQQFGQEARVVGGEVLDEHEGHAAIRRHVA